MFTHKIKVRGFHCDMFGHVNNARYLEFLEETRWEWLNRISNFDYFEKRKMSFVVVSITIHYRHPSVLNDILQISVETKTITNRSASVTQKIIREADKKVIADAEVTFVMVDNSTGKSVVLDEELKTMLAH